MLRSGVCARASKLMAASDGAHRGWSEYGSATTLNLTGLILEAGYEHGRARARARIGRVVAVDHRVRTLDRVCLIASW